MEDQLPVTSTQPSDLLCTASVNYLKCFIN